MSVRCDKAKDQGVPLPIGWQAAFNALRLPEIAQRSAAKAIAETGHCCLQCRVLGTALPLPALASSLQEEQVGSLIVLSVPGGNRSAVVLCAHVHGTQWLCHQCVDGDAAGTIDSAHLVLEDMESATRLDPIEAELDKIVGLIHNNASKFSQLFAEAAWRAEEHRASSRGVPFDADIASVGYEANPFAWQHGNKVDICVAWSLGGSADPPAAADEEMVPSKLSWHRLNNALSKGWSFPAPRFGVVQPIKAEELHSMLEEKAKLTSKSLLWPCGYLGYLVRGDAAAGVFEPDPAKWPVAALEDAGTWNKIMVWFEWQHITVGPEKKPHRVSMRLDHAIAGMKLALPAPQIDTDRCFALLDPQGEQHVYTGVEVLRMLRNMELWGSSKYQAASGVQSYLQQATSDGDLCGDPEYEGVAKAHVQEVMTELEAIASMKGVDFLINETDNFIRILRTGRREEMEITAAKLREPLQKFLSVGCAHGSKLRTVYSAVDAAVDMFQHALADSPANAVKQLARAMAGLSTIGGIGPEKKPHRASMRPQSLVEVDLGLPFKFEGPHGEFELEGFEVWEAMKSRRVFGRAKFEAAHELQSNLQDLVAQMTRDKGQSATAREQDATLRYIKRVLEELEVIAAMEPVDVFIVSYEGFLDFWLRPPLYALQRHTIVAYVEEQLLAPLRRFLSVLGSESCALSTCYASVADALVAFQQAIAGSSPDPGASLVHVLSRCSEPWQSASAQ